MKGYFIDMKWKEDNEKNIPCRHYSVYSLRELLVFLLEYIESEKIEWIKVYIDAN